MIHTDITPPFPLKDREIPAILTGGDIVLGGILTGDIVLLPCRKYPHNYLTL